MLSMITVTVPVPDSPLFWLGVATVALIVTVRWILSVWDKVKP